MDDILCIHHNVDSVLQNLYQSFPIKSGYGDPDMCLGAKFCKIRFHNEIAMNSTNMSMRQWEIVKLTLGKYNGRLRSNMKTENPFAMRDDLDMDISPELWPEAALCSHSIIDNVSWMVELERFDIITKVSLWSSHQAFLKVRHLEKATHVMAYMGQKYDPIYPEIDEMWSDNILLVC